MNKKIEKAISVLENQKQKIKNKKTDSVWQTQTISYIKLYLGEDSPEYKHINTFHYWDERFNYNKEAIEFLDNCIETVKIKGLYKKSGNFITRMDDNKMRWLIGGLCAFLLIIGGIIYKQGYKDAKFEILEFSSKPVAVTPNKPNTNPAKIADTSKR